MKDLTSQHNKTLFWVNRGYKVCQGQSIIQIHCNYQIKIKAVMFGTWLETSTLLVFFTLGVRPYLRLSQPLTSNSKNRIQIVLSPEKWPWLITCDIHFLCNWLIINKISTKYIWIMCKPSPIWIYMKYTLNNIHSQSWT